MRLRFAVVLALPMALTVGMHAAVPQTDGVSALVDRIEQAGAAGDAATILALAEAGAKRQGIEDFASAIASPRPLHLVIKERDRSILDDGVTVRLLLELFVEQVNEGRLGSWRLDVHPGRDRGEGWRIAAAQQLSSVSGLYRLALNPLKQFDVRHLTVTAPDLTLELPAGSAFVAETHDGPTAVVLLGRGVMRFTPSDSAERTQLRLFARSEPLVTNFDAAFIRVRDWEFESHFVGSIVPRALSSSDLRRASAVFDEYVGRTLQIDLNDLSRERWSLQPNAGDLIAEVRTRKFGSLTYVRSGSDPEDVSVFDRKRRKNIAVYASEQKLGTRGRFYSEDDLLDYDVLAYDIDASFAPDRQWLEGDARVKIRIRDPGTTTLTLKLADTLLVRSVYSPGFGRLLNLRVVGQNSILVNLPEPQDAGKELWLRIAYGGRLAPQQLDNEAVQVQTQAHDDDRFVLPLEPRFIYSNRSYWYPQSRVTDYATATLRIVVPAEYDVVASGDPAGPAAAPPGVVDPAQHGRKMFVFEAKRPVRYLACVISRFNTIDTARLSIPSPAVGTSPDDSDGAAHPGSGPALRPAAAGGSSTSAAPRSDDDAVSLFVQGNPRQSSRGRDLSERAQSILQYYASIIGEAPYPSLTVAITDSEVPGGHSPAYVAMLNQSMPGTPFTWRNDPVSFDNYPSFFIAHEIAHQWWGQAIGWKNYHEQWISEGFAQYFAALYASKERGNGVFESIMRQMRDTAIDASDQGPVYLGYRLGHIKNDGRVFRSVIYNKGAVVLQMLRHLVGDEAFFSGLRRFYRTWRYQKASTDDFRQAIQRTTGRDLSRFFDTFIYGSTIPRLKFTKRLNPDGTLLVRFEHRADVTDVPVTVRVNYANGGSEDLIVPVSERVVERTIRLKATLRSVEVNQDGAALAVIER